MDCRINFDGHHHLQLGIHIQARNFVGHLVVLESSWYVLGSCPDTIMRLQLSRSWGIQFFVENFCVMLALNKFCRYINEVLRFAADNSDNSQQSYRMRNSLPTYKSSSPPMDSCYGSQFLAGSKSQLQSSNSSHSLWATWSCPAQNFMSKMLS